MNIKTYLPPLRPYLTDSSTPSVFLAGTIDMGKGELWHDNVVDKLRSKYNETCSKLEVGNLVLDLTVFNPRRKDWDSSWEQKYNNPQFNEQVNWELDFIEQSDFVFFYLKGNASPISLMELGLCCASKPSKTIVFCDKDFHRYGNVEITCRRYGVTVFDNLDCAVTSLMSKLNILYFSNQNHE